MRKKTKEKKGRGKERLSHQLQLRFLRHEAKHRQALMRAADIPVRRGTHNNASVRGRELADLFLHVGSGSRRDGGHGRKNNGSSLLFSPCSGRRKQTLTGSGRRRQAALSKLRTGTATPSLRVVGKLLARWL